MVCPTVVRAFSPLAFLSVLGGQATADIVYVDDDGPADFTDIQDAVDASTHGDVIVVLPGSYSGFEIDGLGLKVLGDKAGGVEISGTIRVANLSPVRVVVLSDLNVTSFHDECVSHSGPPALELESNDGHVRVQSSALQGAMGEGSCPAFGSRAAEVTDSVDVFFQNSTLHGGDGEFGSNDPDTCCAAGSGGEGLRVFGSNVALYDCSVRGGKGSTGGLHYSGGGGGDATQLWSGSFLFSSSTIHTGGRGGPGGDCSVFTTNDWEEPTDGGNGGDGLSTASGTTARILDSTLTGGVGGPPGSTFPVCFFAASPGAPGQAISGAGDVVQLAGVSRQMEISHWLEDTNVASVTFTGLPGDTVHLPMASITDFTYDEPLKGVWQPLTPVTIPPALGVLPASGELSLQVALPPLAPGQLSKTVFSQSYFVDFVGQPILGTPHSTVIFGCDSVPSTYCTAAPNSFGPGAPIGYAGSTSFAANDLTLTVAGAAPTQFGIFFYGPDPTDVPFGDGHLCVTGGIFRLNPVLQTSAQGAASLALDYGDPPMNAGTGEITAGSTWNFQFWYRDPGGPGGNGFNLSDGLAVPFCP